MTEEIAGPAGASSLHGNDAALAQHWKEWRETLSQSARETLFGHYMGYAKSIAAQMFGAWHHTDVEFNDYLQLAYVGLVEAMDRFDPERGVAFTTFCTPRIRGSILNGVEKLTEVQEQISYNRRRGKERLALLKSATEGRAGIDTLSELAAGLAIGFMLEGTGMMVEGEQETPYGNAYEATAWRQASVQLRRAVQTLPPRTRKIIEYHYFEAIPFEQIALLLGLSKGRVSQIHKAGLEALKMVLKPETSLHLTT
jgi:RNA polymerase sigma factor for flagellar operon FliA